MLLYSEFYILEIETNYLFRKYSFELRYYW